MENIRKFFTELGNLINNSNSDNKYFIYTRLREVVRKMEGTFDMDKLRKSYEKQLERQKRGQKREVDKKRKGLYEVRDWMLSMVDESDNTPAIKKIARELIIKGKIHYIDAIEKALKIFKSFKKKCTMDEILELIKNGGININGNQG